MPAIMLYLVLLLSFRLSETIMRILLLRDEEPENDKYHLLFNETGFDDVTSIPPLDFEYQNLAMLKEFVNRISDYAGLIFTSKRAINAFKLATDKTVIKSISEMTNFSIYVVGRSSEICLKELGLVSTGSHTGNAKELSAFIIEQYKSKQFEKPLMFACGNLARETIPEKLTKNDIKCETISCYKTIPNENFLNSLKLYCDNSDPSVIAFFSPSGAEFYLKQIKALTDGFDDNVKLVAIGQYTAEAIERLCQTVTGVANKPTPQDLLDTIKAIHVS